MKSITQLYLECIQLCNLNKVTKKNVWNVPLIDIMEDVIHDNQQKQFQMGSTSINASVKIYSCRVDDIYQSFSEFAQTLHTLQTIEEKNENEKNDENESIFSSLSNISIESIGIKKEVKQKKTKYDRINTMKKQIKTIEKNPSHLLYKDNQQKSYKIDNLFKLFLEQNSSQFFSNNPFDENGIIIGDWKYHFQLSSIKPQIFDENDIIVSIHLPIMNWYETNQIDSI